MLINRQCQQKKSLKLKLDGLTCKKDKTDPTHDDDDDDEYMFKVVCKIIFYVILVMYVIFFLNTLN